MDKKVKMKNEMKLTLVTGNREIKPKLDEQKYEICSLCEIQAMRKSLFVRTEIRSKEERSRCQNRPSNPNMLAIMNECKDLKVDTP